jgi:hypothetical protein
MAARPAKQNQSPNAVLVVFLILFVLAAIGGYTGWYLSANEPNNKDKEIRDLKIEKDNLQKDVEWWKFQAILYKHYLGIADPKTDTPALEGYLATFGVANGTLDELGKGNLAQKKGQDGKPVKRDEVDALVNDIKSPERLGRFPIDANKVKLADPKGYPGLVNDLEEKILTLTKEKEDQVALVEAERAKVKAAEKATEAQKTKIEEGLAEAKKAFTEELQKIQGSKDNEAIEKQLKAARQLADERLQQVEDEKKRANAIELAKQKEIDKLAAELKQAQILVNQRTQEIAVLKQRGEDAPKSLRADWKIVRLMPGGQTAYINLGVEDNVAPQLTFSIHGIGPDGKPEQTPKGSLEVVNPQRGHVSEVRITQIRDRQRFPILEGDVLFNPTWSPSQKKHVAIAGIVDLAGDGQRVPEQLRQFIEYLARQNIIVDCYLDLNDLEFKRDGKPITVADGITINTEYLIIGPGGSVIAEGVDQTGYRIKLDKKLGEITKRASDTGVPVVGLPKYLDNIGYRLTNGAALSSPTYRVFPPPLKSGPKEDKKEEKKMP